MIRALTGAFAFATVLPLPGGGAPPGRAMLTALPVTGAALGALTAGVAWGATEVFGAGSALPGQPLPSPSCWRPPAVCTSMGCPTPSTAWVVTARRREHWQ